MTSRFNNGRCTDIIGDPINIKIPQTRAASNNKFNRACTVFILQLTFQRERFTWSQEDVPIINHAGITLGEIQHTVTGLNPS